VKNPPGDAAKVSADVTKYAKPLAVLQSLDPATSAALSKNPADPAALPTALSEVAKQQGASAATQAQVKQIATTRSDELITASAIDAKTLAALSGGSTAPALIATAQGEIAKARNISSSAALTKLLALASPAVKADLAVVTPFANTLLAANAAIPAADLALIQKYGAVLQGAQAGIPPATLAKLTKAGNDTPHQWQHWWWVCFIAQLVFLPFIFLLTGRWSPGRARRDEEEHEALVERELAELHQHAQA
jgi:hypothetical protein